MNDTKLTAKNLAKKLAAANKVRNEMFAHLEAIDHIHGNVTCTEWDHISCGEDAGQIERAVLKGIRVRELRKRKANLDAEISKLMG